MPLAPHIPQCHHIRTNGLRCGSPSMRGRNHCFYHLRTTAIPRARPTNMPNLEDGNAIQLGLASVIRRLLTYDIDYRAAYCLLHAYKLALWNLKNCHLTAGYDPNLVMADPLSDPENAGQATEPQTLRDIKQQYKAQHPEEFSEEKKEPEPDENEQLAQFLARELCDPYEAVPTTEPSADLEKRETKNEKPVFRKPQPAIGKPVKRIVIPKEISDLINAENHADIPEEEFKRLAAELLGTRTG